MIGQTQWRGGLRRRAFCITVNGGATDKSPTNRTNEEFEVWGCGWKLVAPDVRLEQQTCGRSCVDSGPTLIGFGAFIVLAVLLGQRQHLSLPGRKCPWLFFVGLERVRLPQSGVWLGEEKNAWRQEGNATGAIRQAFVRPSKLEHLFFESRRAWSDRWRNEW
jgi:hypothetical protein